MATELDANAAIYRRLASAHLPALPQVVLQVMRQCEDETCGLSEIAAVVGQDAAISARVVSVAHAPHYHRGRKLDGLNQCLAVLGTQAVRRIALNQAVLDLFGRFQGAGKIDLVPFWCHALYSALLARDLAEQLDYPRLEEAYLAGLLHDIGRLALLAAVPEIYKPLFDADLGQEALIAQESALLNLTHAEAGGWLAERWQLDPLFCDGLRYHHEAADRVRQAHPLAQIVYLANRLAHVAPEAAWIDEWGLDSARIEALVQTSQTEFRRIAEEFGIPLSDAEREIGKAAQAREKAEAELAQATSARLLAQGACIADTHPNETAQALMTIFHGAELLFGTGRAGFLQVSNGELRGLSPDGQVPRLEEIRIPLSGTDSAIAGALVGRPLILRSGGADRSLADRQVMHLLAAEALLCLPLRLGGEAMGVLIFALDEATADDLSKKGELLSAYATESSRCLNEVIEGERSRTEMRQSLHEAYLLRARQTVHEVANPLGVIHNYLAILRDRLASEAELIADIDLMRDELRRASGILDQLKQTEAPIAEASDRIDLNALLRQVITFCRMGKPEMARVETRWQLDETLPFIHSNRNKLKQILINIIFNAVEALPEGGRLFLSSAYWRSGRHEGQVEISIEDNGPGIPEEVLRRLYTPVASPKGGSHGGLGLAIVGRLVEDLGAVLQCHSTRAGTRFKLLLPVHGETTGTRA